MKDFLKIFKIPSCRPTHRESVRHNAFAFTPLREFDSLLHVDSEMNVFSPENREPGERGDSLKHPPGNPRRTRREEAIPDEIKTHPDQSPMKTILAILLTVSTLFLNPASAQNSAQAIYNQGVSLFNEEKYDEALILFEQVLKASPNFVYARNYAARCKTAMAQNLGPKNDLEGRLARVIIPEIAFADAPIGDVLDYLASRAQELTKGETVVNFIYKGTPEQRSGTPITLSLRSVPLSEAIKYVGELSRSKIKYEPHAVVIDPNPGAEPVPAAGTTPAPAPGFSAPTPTTTPTSKSTFP
jgi:hypothetical protein